MKIVRELALWMLKEGKISLSRYCFIKEHILKESLDPETERLVEERLEREQGREEYEDSRDEWWTLRSAGLRPGAKRAGGSCGRLQGQVSIKVWDLEPKLPCQLMDGMTEFPLAYLLFAVAGKGRFVEDWSGFVDCCGYLYKLGAEELHDALFAAVVRNGRKLTPLLLGMEGGETLFPEGFLSGYSGRSVSIVRRRVEGNSGAFFHGKTDWILKYPNFNAINEACLVRNRIRRIFRLWVAEGTQFDAEGHFFAEGPSLFLALGKSRMRIPFQLWCDIRPSGQPLPKGLSVGRCYGRSRSGLIVEARVDGVVCKALLDDLSAKGVKRDFPYDPASVRVKSSNLPIEEKVRALDKIRRRQECNLREDVREIEVKTLPGRRVEVGGVVVEDPDTCEWWEPEEADIWLGSVSLCTIGTFYDEKRKQLLCWRKV